MQDVAIERSRVSLARVKDNGENAQSLREAITQVVAPFGGLNHYLTRRSRVLLKPHQILFHRSLTGATTSPRLIRVLIDLCFEAGAREVWVAGESCQAQRSREVMSRNGMVRAVKGSGAHLIYLDEMAEKVFDFGLDAEDLRYMPAPEILERADVVINVPKAKTDFLDPITCACKNWSGLIPASYRLYLQQLGDAYYRANALFLRKFRPTLNLVDGVIAGEGQGPGVNTPFHWGWLLASEDPVATDVSVCRLFELPCRQLRMAREAAEQGVGIFAPEWIDLVGATFEEARVSVRPADPSVHRYPCRVIVAKDATIEGTIGHWKMIADSWLEKKVWPLLISRGTPTFLFGAAEDPEFEEHVREGPYVVLDDAALDKYKYDPRVVFVPGSPVPQSYIQNEMVEDMGFGSLDQPCPGMHDIGAALVGRMSVASGAKGRVRALAQVFGLSALAFGLPLMLRSFLTRRNDENAKASAAREDAHRSLGGI